MSITIIYTKPGCPYCVAAKEDMDARGVEYQEIDVYANPGARETVIELTGGTGIVPVVIDPDGEVHVAAGGG